MKTIYRYQIPITDRPTLSMPAGAHILPAPPGERNDGSDIEIWAEVDTTRPLEPRGFTIVGTGNPMPDEHGAFVGTVVTHGGQFVWHIFEG